MNHDFIERYIYAVTKRMPGKTREDVAKELRSLIADMLEERCGEVIPTEKDIRVVLTELGTPEELYAQYSGDGKKCLIGQPYYSIYVYVLKIVLLCVAFGMTLAAVLSMTIGGEYIDFIRAIGRWFGMLWSGGVFAFAFVTLLFAFFDYKKVSLDTCSGLDNLPPVPEKRERISKADPMIGIAISVLFFIVMLVCPQVFCAVLTDAEGAAKFISIFNTEVIRNYWYLIGIFTFLGVFRESMKLLDGKYSRRVVISSIVTDLLSGIFTIFWLTRKNIISGEFVDQIAVLFEGESEFIVTIFANFQYFFMGIILFALLLDMLDTIVRGAKAIKE